MNDKKKIVESEGFNVIFGGGSSIDAELYSRSIGAIDRLIKENGKVAGIKSKGKNADSSLRLEVNAVKEGSVDIGFVISVLGIIGMGVGILCGISKFTLDCFKIKKHLKGEPEKNKQDLGDETIIENKDGEKQQFPTYVVNIYYSNPTIDQLICKIFINNHREYVLITSGKDLVEIWYREFEGMRINTLVGKIVGDDKIIKTELYIVKADFSGESKWRFKMKDELIDAKVDDKVFMAEIRNGSLELHAGLKIRCNLKIDKKFGSTGKIIPEYTVVKVYDKPF